MSVSTENIQTTVSQLNREFAGRHDSEGYKPENPIHIHRRNRAFVWNKHMQEKKEDDLLEATKPLFAFGFWGGAPKEELGAKTPRAAIMIPQQNRLL